MISARPHHRPPPSPPPLRSPLLRRLTLSLQQRVQRRLSFIEISDRAAQLELGCCSNSDSPEAIAAFLLLQQQPEAIESVLFQDPQQQRALRRLGFHQSIHLLTLSVHRTWDASIVCASVFKKVLSARCAINRIQIILDSPSSHSQVKDLLRLLADLHNSLSVDSLHEIQVANTCLVELAKDLNKYQRKARVQVLSVLADITHGVKNRLLCSQIAPRHAKADLRSKLFTCGIYGMRDGSDTNEEEPSAVKKDGSDHNDDGVALDTVRDSLIVPPLNGTEGSSGNVLSTVCRIHVRLNQIQRHLYAISRAFETLMTLVQGTHEKRISSHLVDCLRDDPLMFDGVAGYITDCNTRLNDDLNDLKEQLVHCLRYINRARAWGSAI